MPEVFMSQTDPPSINPIVAMFEWWNTAMAEPSMLDAQAFARFFAADATLVVNGNLRATGCEALARHYRAVAAHCNEVAMVLPVEESFFTRERAFVHCRTRVQVAGRMAAEEAMAYAKLVDDGRMSALRVVSLSV
jgi:uncharacterized protein (TIGR02246 family)